MKTEIFGPTVTLRRYETAFAPLLHEAAIESRDAEFARWMPWCHAHYSLAESEEFIARSRADWETGAQYNFAVFDARGGRLLGGAGLNQRHPLHHFMNLGYWVRAGGRRRGAASEAARLLAETALAELPLNRLEILVTIENTASLKTAERAGARREGVLRRRLQLGAEVHDAVMFSFVREDFRR